MFEDTLTIRALMHYAFKENDLVHKSRFHHVLVILLLWEPLVFELNVIDIDI